MLTPLWPQRLLALPFLVLGAWCLVAPHMVERLGITPEYQHLSTTSALLFMLSLCVWGYRIAPARLVAAPE